MPSCKERMNYTTQGMIFLLLSPVHVSIIMSGGGLEGPYFLGIRNAALCPRRYKHLCCVQKEEKIYSLSPGAVLTVLPEHQTAK